jgi:hypothetical protein
MLISVFDVCLFLVYVCMCVFVLRAYVFCFAKFIIINIYAYLYIRNFVRILSRVYTLNCRFLLYRSLSYLCIYTMRSFYPAHTP